MDYINSEKLFACGWICELHPRLYNRNELKSWIDSINNTVSSKIKVYPRTIFTVNGEGKKNITNAVIIDGALEDAKEIMKFLYSIDWDKKYRDVSFVPFRSSQTLTKQDQKEAMEYHNNYLHCTYRKLVKIANPTKVYALEEGISISFRDWLLQSKLHEKQMIQGVETMKDGIVRIIYDKDNQTGVDYIMETLKENTIEAFGTDIAMEMLGEDFELITHFNSELEDQHATKIKSAWKGKSNKYTAPPQPQHQIYYGSNKSEKLYQSGDSKSYSEITQSTMS